MKSNVGSSDKVVRIVLGIVLLSLLFLVDGALKWFGLIGIVLILTALVNFCPLYRLFGINTCKIQSRT
ncbi:YgaP family membrane protein [Salipaludibacillus daqingensis]|uniref:YgaP family membrane protein n=1 Tax=Salipaludibacillus daqingensis TaxID=3041001 RepID=UPI002476D7F1|nr:DUF2892 domain-containing protein [Salipaludibacillus daqingensis]